MESYVNKYILADTSMCMSDSVYAFITVIQNVCDYTMIFLQMINQEKMQSCTGKYDVYKHNTTISLNNTVHVE